MTTFLSLQEDIWILILSNYCLSCRDIVHLVKSCRFLNRIVDGSPIIFKRLLEASFDSALPEEVDWKDEYLKRMKMLHSLRAVKIDEEATPFYKTGLDDLLIGTEMETCKTFNTIERILVETDSSILDMGSVLGKMTTQLLDAISDFEYLHGYPSNPNTHDSPNITRLAAATDNLMMALKVFTLTRQSYHVPIAFLNEASINEAFRVSVLHRLEGWGGFPNGNTGMPQSLSVLTSWFIVFKTFRVYSNDYFIPYTQKAGLRVTGEWAGTYFYKNHHRDLTDGLVTVTLEQEDETGVVCGRGIDTNGPFTITGKIRENGQVDFVKRYSTHFFLLVGRYIAGVLAGYWGLPDYYGGEFLFVLKCKKKIRDDGIPDFNNPTV